MNIIKFNNQTYNTDKYVFTKTLGISDKTNIHGVLNTEEDLAIFSFFNFYYKSHILSQVCSYYDITAPDGHHLTDQELDSIIEKYFPKETKIIQKRMTLLNNKFINVIYESMNGKLIDHWTQVYQKIIDNSPTSITNTFNFIKEESELNTQKIFNLEKPLIKKIKI